MRTRMDSTTSDPADPKAPTLRRSDAALGERAAPVDGFEQAWLAQTLHEVLWNTEEAAQRQIDRYTILRRLGAGGMGVVYAAYDQKLDRKVALKLIRPERASDQDAQERLLREARAMARLSHRSIVQIYEVGQVGTDIFLAMEFIEGQTLDAWLAARPRTLREIVRVFIQAGEGLAVCDDANQDQDDGCTASCQIPVCGDGFVQPGLGETCDQGMDNAESGQCTPSCAVAVCGDGLVLAGIEACDDGNAVANDGCTNDCKLPSCGDGLLQAGELCDLGQNGGDSCSIDCKAKCLSLQPGPDLGNDTRAWSRPDKVNEKLSNWSEFSAIAWTWDGVPGVIRSFIQFDFSEIPQSAQVTSAMLNLYGIGKHSSLSHSNASVLRRVVDPWQEGGVSWASQPQATSLNEVTLPQSVNANQDYSVNLLPLVKYAVIDPDNSQGFSLRLKDESYYASMQFASSDHPDPSKRPRLQVCYRVE
jgi:cysteine-rich repeat protein